MQTCRVSRAISLAQDEANGAAVQAPAELGDVRLQLAKLGHNLSCWAWVLFCVFWGVWRRAGYKRTAHGQKRGSSSTRLPPKNPTGSPAEYLQSTEALK